MHSQLTQGVWLVHHQRQEPVQAAGCRLMGCLGSDWDDCNVSVQMQDQASNPFDEQQGTTGKYDADLLRFRSWAGADRAEL